MTVKDKFLLVLVQFFPCLELCFLILSRLLLFPAWTDKPSDDQTVQGVPDFKYNIRLTHQRTLMLLHVGPSTECLRPPAPYLTGPVALQNRSCAGVHNSGFAEFQKPGCTGLQNPTCTGLQNCGCAELQNSGCAGL